MIGGDYAAGATGSAVGEGQGALGIQATGTGRWRRRVATLVAFVVLVVVGREVRPAVSRAATPTPDASAIELGSLVSRATRLEMALRQGEMRFRVVDAQGKVLAADLSEAQLAARFPRLDLRMLHAQQLMLAEPGDER